MKPHASLLLLLVVACASEGGGSSQGACEGASCGGAASCPSGLTRDEETSGACVDVAPAEDCPSGTAAMLGTAECAPIGWTSCAAPFAKNEKGWGCRAEIAPACTATTREEIGRATCVPIGDCSAPFPPANTTITVDATLATEDATHKKSIFNAAAEAKPGDVIAVMPGKYVEDVDIERSQVTLVGKCAAEVTIENPGDRRAGILVTGKGARVRGFTLKGHMTGVLVKAGGEAVVEDVAIIDNRWLGVYAAEAGSKLRLVKSRIDGVVQDGGKFGWGAAAQLGGAIDLEDVVITRATAHGVAVVHPNSTGKLSRTIVRSIRAADGFADGISAADSSSMTIDGALVDDVRAVGLMASGASVEAKHLVIQNVAVDGKNENGRGIQVSKGGKLTLEESQISSTDDANVLVLEPSSRLEIEKSTILGDPKRDPSRAAHGVRVALGASLAMKNSAIVSAVDIGLSVQDMSSTAEIDGVLVRETRARKWKDGAELGIGIGVAWSAKAVITHSSIVKNRAAGILVSRIDDKAGAETAAHADIKSTLVRDQVGDAAGNFGRGIEVTLGASATIEDSAIVKNNETSIVVGREGASAVVRRTIIRDTQQRAALFGHGVIADSESTVVLEESWLLRHPGVALAVVSSGATLARSLVAQSGVGVNVQGDATLEVVSTVPTPPSRRAVSVSEDTRFEANATRVGNGAIPIPMTMGFEDRH